MTKNVNFKLPVFILSLVSVGAALIAALELIFKYVIDYSDFEYRFRFIFPSFSQTFSFIFAVAAGALLALYVFIFYKKSNSSLLLFASIGAIVISNVEYAMNSLNNIGYQISYNYDAEFTFLDISRVILSVGVAALLAIALVFVQLKKSNYKIFAFIGIGVGLLDSLLDFIQWIITVDETYGNNEFYLYIFTDFMAVVSAATVLVALLLFIIRNEIGEAKLELFGNDEVEEAVNEAPAEVNTEDALTSLKNEFEAGAITEEEYNAKRAEIIANI